MFRGGGFVEGEDEIRGGGFVERELEALSIVIALLRREKEELKERMRVALEQMEEEIQVVAGLGQTLEELVGDHSWPHAAEFQNCLELIPDLFSTGSDSSSDTDTVNPLPVIEPTGTWLPPYPASSPHLPRPHSQLVGSNSALLGSPGIFFSPGFQASPPPLMLPSSLAPPLAYRPPDRWYYLDAPCCPASIPLPISLPSLEQDELPLEYHHPPFSAFHLYPEMPSEPLLGIAREQPQQPDGGEERYEIEEASAKIRRSIRPPVITSPTIAVPDSCPMQLLTTANPEPSLEVLPAPLPSQTLQPAVPETPNTFCAEPVSYLMDQSSSRLSPTPSPLPSTSTATSTEASSVPKMECPSPTPVCARTQEDPEEGPSVSMERLTSPSRSSSAQKKSELNKAVNRRMTHLLNEHRRLFNIKMGFVTLRSLVNIPSARPGSRVGKAITLQKTIEYIRRQQQERAALQDEAQSLRDQIEELNAAIDLCQKQLPDTGVPITRRRFDHMREMFDEYVRSCTLKNWKFWVFSIIMRPFFESFNGMVSTASVESLTQTSLAWLDQCCSLPTLRSTALSSLRQFSASTSILTDPAAVPEQAVLAVKGTVPQMDPPNQKE